MNKIIKLHFVKGFAEGKVKQVEVTLDYLLNTWNKELKFLNKNEIEKINNLKKGESITSIGGSTEETKVIIGRVK
jgi:hypothetical protein